MQRLFARDGDLWPKVAPYLTLLGRSETLDVVAAPPVLRAAATPANVAEVNFSDVGQPGSKGFYEVWLHVDAPELDRADPEGRLWTHVSALAGADHRLHIMALGWPETTGGGS